MIDLNTRPYFDDFDENKKFYKILFRPGFAVQARELTQLQTILQNQVKLHGDHIFRQGAMVIPGQMSIDTNVDFVKLQPTYLGEPIDSYLNEFEGEFVTGENNLTAQVLKVLPSEGTDPATLYVRYVNSGNEGTTKVFQPNETISVGSFSVQAQSSAATGKGASASIERGVYYVNGHFVLVEQQYIIIEKYSNIPSYRVGLTIDEQLISPEDDGTLLDNAQGSYNFAAPGAHRYYIDLTLSTRALDSVDDEDFVELLRVDNGTIQRHVTKTEYSELEKTLARRTYDESGDYVVRNFSIDVREHRDNNRGEWATNKAYLIGDVVVSNGKTYVAKNSATSVSVPPSHTTGSVYDGPGSTGVQWEYNENPFYNRGVFKPENGGDENKLAVGLEPGKAYVQGYEIEKIATEYVDVNKSREFVNVDNAIIPATVGNFIYTTNTNNLPPVNTYGLVTLYDGITGSTGRGTPVGTAVGTARVRFYEWHSGTIGQTSAVYKLGLFDVKMNDNKCLCRSVKSFYFNVSNNPALSFTADIEPQYMRLVGSVSATSSTTVTGVGTSFQTDLIVGDYVRLGTEIRRVEEIISQTQIGVNSAVTVSGATIDMLRTDIVEPENASLLFPFPYYAIKSVRGTLGTNDTTYTVYERFTGNSTAASGGVCTLTVSTSSGTFASAADPDNYIVVNNSSSTGGSVVVPTNISVVGSSVTFTLNAALASTSFVVIGAVNKTGASLTEKTKTLQSGTVTFTSTAAAMKNELSLSKADIYRVVSVKMDSGTFAAPTGNYTIDITDRYDLDSGQRNTHYDIGRLILKSSYTPPTAPVQVQFEYFTHGPGDYFTINSYPSNVSYSAIPTFGGTDLRDQIDFRPRIADDGVSFTGSGSSTALTPKRGIDVRTDFQYYLARKTKIAIDFNGNFFAIDGVSALNPGEPLDPSIGLVLYTLDLEPYTFTTTSRSVVITPRDNRRYTMRDIGKLEKRIDNLEYYTSLSLLEQQTESLDIIDSDGESRFKNGFIVDNFTGHNTGDVNSPDYLCSIDMENGELRPFFSMQNVNLIEKAVNNTQRTAGNYQLYGDVITLPVVDNVPLVKQEYASRVENINPFAVFTFLGNVQLTPSSDDWFEVNRRPDIVNEVEGNFNTIKTLAEKAGVLGTIWNAWQTQWTGTPVTRNLTFTQTGWNNTALNQQLANAGLSTTVGNIYNQGNAGLGAGGRRVVIETTATQIGQSRAGVRTTLVTKIDRQVVADRILSTAAIPYIRSRNVLVQVRGLKPQTKFYPFFDNVSVAEFCTPASRLVFTQISGTFDETTNVGGLAAETARRIQNDSQVCLNRGDVITGQSSGATAVVVGSEFDSETSTRALYVANIRGTFTAGEIILGSISGAQGNFVSVQTKVLGDDLISNFSGDLALLFNIPNTESIRFRTGTREFKLVDTDQPEGLFTSRGRQLYRAQGVLETRQQTVNAVRNAELVEEQLIDNRVIVQTSERIVSDTGWYDPLAQTFLVESTGGAFLTKVDVFFASKDLTIPVNLEIREVVNGYPGKLVLPFSRVSLKPEQVNLSSNTVLLDGVNLPKYDTPTTFVFPSPVYVQHNTEYAIVLSSDSNNYRVWISQVGDQIPGSTRTISEQPYQGVFFKSQNASTWTADQMQDLKFTVYRAQFATDAIANIEFVNDVLPRQRLDIDPFEVKTGVTKVRVYQRDHGMPVGSVVTIDNTDSTQVVGVQSAGTITSNNGSITGTGTAFTSDMRVGSVLYTLAGTYIGQVQTITSDTALTLTAPAAIAVTNQQITFTNPIGGIPTTEIYKQHTISDVDMDSYTITVGTAATENGYFGGTTVRASRNLQFDEIQPSVQIQTFPETTATFGVKTVSGKSPDGSQSPYVADTDFQPVLANENNVFFTPRMVASEQNENLSLSGNKSLTFNVTMKTDNPALSPVLDTQRTSIVVVQNKIDNPSETNNNVGGLDDIAIVSSNVNIAFEGNIVKSSDAVTKAALQTLAIGKYINIAGTTGALNNGTFLVTDIADDGVTTSVTVDHTFTTQAAGVSVSITMRAFFVAEIAPVGSSAYSKYVTRQINLATASTFARIRFAASIPPESMVDVYYKTLPLGAIVPLDDINYTKVESDKPIVFTQVGSNRFIDLDFSTGNIPAFDAIQVKLVMRSTNTSAVPRVRDLRIIACA